LNGGDLIRHFAVTTADGTLFDSYDTWQRRNLLLIALPSGPLSAEAQRFVSSIKDRQDALDAFEARCVVTSELVPCVDAPVRNRPQNVPQ
jgi:hypothetical protein